MDMYNPDQVDCDTASNCHNQFKTMAGIQIDITNNFPTTWKTDDFWKDANKDLSNDNRIYLVIKDDELSAKKGSDERYPICEMLPECVQEHGKLSRRSFLLSLIHI